MKKLSLRVFEIVRRFPRDVRQAIGSFCLSSTIMVLALFALSLSTDVKTIKIKEKITPIELCGLEPYYEMPKKQTDLVTLSLAKVSQLSSSDDLSEELLAYAIEENTAGESYAVRVGFGAVLLNRVSDEAFPDTLSGVLTSSGLYPTSFDANLSDRSRHAARDAMLGVDPTVGALYMISLSDPSFKEYESRITAVYGNCAFLK